LRDAGIHVGIVSNIDDDQFGPLWQKIGLDSLVNATTTSEGARSCKPYPEIYQIALGKTGGVAPHETVFVGDSVPHDVAGANALGMTSVLLSKQALEPNAKAIPHHVVDDLRTLLDIARR
jgi:putative hydrolase of the HAD superfamily